MSEDNFVSFRTCLLSQLSNKAIIPGSIIMCYDSGDLYYDNKNNDRLHVAKSITYFSTDSERTSLLYPENDMLYIVKATGEMWIYNSGWINLTGNKTDSYYFYIFNVAIAANNVQSSVLDSRVTAESTAKFIPDISLYDLVDNNVTITCSCAAGRVNVTSSCAYPLNGIIEVLNT